MRKVAVVTGTRADYGIFYPVLKAIEEDGELELILIVTGMHLSPRYGLTVRDIERDGFTIFARVDMLVDADTGGAMAKSTGLALLGIAQALEQAQPDMLLVLGDRGEMLAAAAAAGYMNIPVFHLHGGEVSGTVDERVRHAISKLAHFHFPATRSAAERLIKMGEEEWRVQVVGAPRLDTIRMASLPSRPDIYRRLGLNPERTTALAIYHPVTDERASQGEKMDRFLDALLASGLQVVLIYPNADAGGREMIARLNRVLEHPDFLVVPSLDPHVYLALLKNVDLMVGNSSSGIIEAASFKVPVVNVGDRQAGRERSGNVVDCGEEKEAILAAIKYVLTDRDFREKLKQVTNVYGDGRAAERIVACLKTIPLDERLLKKRIAY